MQYCIHPGCSQLVPRGYCSTHGAKHVQVRRWYATQRWFRLRDVVLREAAYTCARCHRVQIDLQVDHIRPHDDDPGLFWNPKNLQALCLVCHARKSRHETR
jgi:5-methylcytosine-specific restriction enzyme A